jgi:uncharacterized protein (DUF1015 family)
VIAPPYDVVTSKEARFLASSKPWSFLHISRPEIDLPPTTDPYSPEVYAKAKENFQRQIDQGILQKDAGAYYYLYRLIMGSHSQTGLVAVSSVAAYEKNLIRKHEFTRPDKEDDRVRQIDSLNAQTGPVFLTYKHSHAIDGLIEMETQGIPMVDVTGENGVRHLLWIVKDRSTIENLNRAFDHVAFLYIADGHHRSAAAGRVASLRRKRNPNHTGEEAYNFFLSVIFPDNQMKILDYNRVVKDLYGLTPNVFLKKIREGFSIQPETVPVKPAQSKEFGMYLPGQWYRLVIKPGKIKMGDPVKRLDVSVLADHLISPILRVSDPRRDKRIDFVGGIRGLQELQRRVDSGEMAVAFSLFPTTLSDLMAVADAGEVMPPKSTWFEPKLADGMVSHLLE